MVKLVRERAAMRLSAKALGSISSTEKKKEKRKDHLLDHQK